MARLRGGDVPRGLTRSRSPRGLAARAARSPMPTLDQVLADAPPSFSTKGGETVLRPRSRPAQVGAQLQSGCRRGTGSRGWRGGCDPGYLARRLTRMAVEDLGLAIPRAVDAIESWDAYERLGSPEGDLALGQLVLYLASTAKSNAAYVAFAAARADVRQHGTREVPLHLRNAPTKLMKDLGYAKGYQYDHDAEGGIAIGQTGFPEAMGERVYYRPVDRGLEIKLGEKRIASDGARGASGRRSLNAEQSGAAHGLFRTFHPKRDRIASDGAWMRGPGRQGLGPFFRAGDPLVPIELMASRGPRRLHEDHCRCYGFLIPFGPRTPARCPDRTQDRCGSGPVPHRG